LRFLRRDLPISACIFPQLQGRCTLEGERMGKGIAQKILDAHIVEGVAGAGNEVGIRIDQTLTQDATGTMAYLQFEAMGFERVKTELSVSYVTTTRFRKGSRTPTISATSNPSRADTV
jgi:hypothetical protein